jgi:hypothetical protein
MFKQKNLTAIFGTWQPWLLDNGFLQKKKKVFDIMTKIGKVRHHFFTQKGSVYSSKEQQGF